MLPFGSRDSLIYAPVLHSYFFVEGEEVQSNLMVSMAGFSYLDPPLVPYDTATLAHSFINIRLGLLKTSITQGWPIMISDWTVGGQQR